MATANPIVNPQMLVCDPDQYSGNTPSCSSTFDKTYLRVSIKKLLYVHTSHKERWSIIHWMTSYPFVSHEWADIELRQLLERAAERLKDSGEISSEDIDPLGVIERDVPSLGLRSVCFSVTKKFEIVPYATSYEAVCLRLGLDPEELWQHVQYLMRQRGVQHAMDNDESLVKEKIEPAPKTEDMFGTDFSDPLTCIIPISQKEIGKQMDREIKQHFAERQKAEDGKSFDDKLDKMVDYIESMPSTAPVQQRLDEIDDLYDQLGLNESVAA